MANTFKLTGRPAHASGQKALVVEAFKELGSATAHEVAEWLDKDARFKSVQSSTRVAFYYTTLLYKENVLEHVDSAATYPWVENTHDATTKVVEFKPEHARDEIVIVERVGNVREIVKF